MDVTDTGCAACGQANRAGARFCAGCGAALTVHCTACGAEMTPDARFCDACGARAGDGGGPAEIDGTRKTVSVIFSDLAGSTAMQEALDPESVRRVMARFYEVMRETVERNGGAVEKFIGDAIVAVFGTPAVREDDAYRAVRCAGEMAVALEALNDDLERTWGVRLAMRTGVNTGELVISGEGIIVGDTMNTAARLEQAAAAGQVLIGESTWRLVRRQVTAEEVEPLELKGKVDTVRAWRLVSATAQRDDDDAPADTPLVGRDAELSRLRAVLDQAAAARACRLVTVIGSPGLGKSRLAAEFAREVRTHANIVNGHCEPTGEGNTFLPVAEIIREVAGIGEADTPEIACEKLLALNPDDPDRDRLVAATAGVLGIAQPASAQETFWALRRGLEVLARERPLVLVLDDLHWAQPMLLDLVEHLVEWIADAPVLLVALARPELRETREVLTAVGRRAIDVIELEPLPPGESRALVDGLLGQADLPAELIGRILETTEGNPLFLGELVRMLIDEGTLIRIDEGWAVAGGAGTVDVPPTIQALLSARIERLRADERSVVERAAVIGQQFYRGAVAELLAPPVRAGIDGHLESLRRKEMVEPEGIYWIDEPVYRFHHALIRDAAYRLLLKEARAVLHERFADWLEAKAGELVGEYEEVLAFHLEQAHSYLRELGPLNDAGRALGVRASGRLASAGRRALAREDLAAAQNLLSRALECDETDAAATLWDLAETVLSAGDVGAAADVVARYGEASGDDAGRQARAVVIRGQLANLTGADDPGSTAESVRAAAAELAELGDGAGEAKGWAVVAQTNARLGRVGEVETALDRALTAARAADDRRRTTAVLAAAPRAALWGPSSVVRASGRCLDVVRILRMTDGNRHVEALALRCQAVLEAMRGRLDAAREILAGARATFEELGLTLELHETEVSAGTVELLADDAESAVEQFMAARAGFASLGAETAAAGAAALLARALVARGGPGDVEEALAQVKFAREHGGEDLRTALIAACADAEALAQSGRLDEAIVTARGAVALAEPTDALPDKADASLSLARVLTAAGDHDDAREAALAAAACYQAKGHTVGAATAQALSSTSPTSSPVARAQQAVLADHGAQRFAADHAQRFALRNLDRIMEQVHEDFEARDHRAVVSQAPSIGRDAVRGLFEGMLAAAEELRMDVDEVLACDDRVIAMRVAYRGRAATGGGEIEVQSGHVTVFEDGLLYSTDSYDYDDDLSMIVRYSELGGGLSALGDLPPERWFAKLAPRFARQQIEPILELISDGYTLIDHRQLAWEPVHGRDAFIAMVGSAFGTGLVWQEVEEVLACDDRVIALRLTYRGTSVDGDATWEIPFGIVTVIEDDLQVRTEHFNPDDRDAMLARYAELAGKSAALGDLPPERFYAEFGRLWAALDIPGLRELFVDDFRLSDHRMLQLWGEIRGIGAEMAFISSAIGDASARRCEALEVLACDDRAIAVVLRWSGDGSAMGPGEWVIQTGVVSTVRDGQHATMDVYEPEDRQVMVARYTELGGGLLVLGDSAPERWYVDFALRFAGGDIDHLLELISDDFELIDHRIVGWDPVRGRDGLAALVTSSWASLDIRVEFDEVLAVNENVIALRLHWAGHSEDAGGGEFLIEAGDVALIEDGQIVREEHFEPGDRTAILARFAELSSERAATLGELTAERAAARRLGRYNAHDLEGYVELHTEDFAVVDHRRNGWETSVGRDALRAQIAAVFAMSSDARQDIDELIACDDRVTAGRLLFSGHANEGGGEFELVVGYVNVYERGLCVSNDVYEPDERQAIVARYTELGGGLAALGDTAPERVWREFARRFARKEMAPLLELFSEDYVNVDHRMLGWEPIGGHEGVRAVFDSAWATPLDIRVEVDEVLAVDERVMAFRIRWVGHMAEGGGEGIIEVGEVAVIEQGQIQRAEYFAPDDREAMLTRFRELAAERRP